MTPLQIKIPDHLKGRARLTSIKARAHKNPMLGNLLLSLAINGPCTASEARQGVSKDLSEIAPSKQGTYNLLEQLDNGGIVEHKTAIEAKRENTDDTTRTIRDKAASVIRNSTTPMMAKRAQLTRYYYLNEEGVSIVKDLATSRGYEVH